MTPRVFIGMATVEYMLSDCAFSFTQVVKHTSASIDTLFANGRSNSLANSLMGFVRTARAVNASHIMLMEHDHTWPEDTVLRLLAHDKPIVGATYAGRTPPHRIFGVELDMTPIDISRPEVREVMRLPLGAILIRTDVFNGWEEPLFADPWQPERGFFGTCDYAFCNRARQSGASIWLDPQLSLELTPIANVQVQLDGAQVALETKVG